MKKLIFTILAYCLCYTLLSQAEEASLSDSTPPQLTVCAACHGKTGNSSVPEWPHLASQHANYLVRQLQAFKLGGDKGRVNEAMNTSAATLSEVEMTKLANFYAKQTITTGSTPKQYFALGQQIYRAGHSERQLVACIACHGPQGLGNELAYIPRISGQQAAYTIVQLKAYRNRSRVSPKGMMNDIAAKMRDDEIIAIAHYLAGLH